MLTARPKRSFYLITAIILLSIFGQLYAEELKTYKDERYGFTIAYPSSCRILKNYQGAALVIFFPRFALLNENISVIVTYARPLARSLEEVIDIYFKYSSTVLEKKQVYIDGVKFLSVVQLQEKRFWFFTLKVKTYSLITVRGTKICTMTYTALAENYDRYIDKAKEIMQTFKVLD